MSQSNLLFGNCIECHQSHPLDANGRCRDCAIREIQLIEQAYRILDARPGVNREEIAQELGIPIIKVNDWMRQGILRCVVIDAVCPRCHERLVNCLRCEQCGYNLIESIKENQKGDWKKKTKFRFYSTSAWVRDRFSRDRKRLTLQQRIRALRSKFFRVF